MKDISPMNKMGSVSELLDTKAGSMIISIILGLGLAAMFRQVCKGKQCIVIKGPNVNDTQKYYYKVNEDCYKYTPVVTECDE